jgi:hypothetical protein
MAKPTFDEVWRGIESLAGQVFHTITGLEFTYHVSGSAVTTTRTKYNLSRADLQTVYGLVPVSGPREINDLVRGPAYVWAILHDPRVSGNAW